MLTKCQMSNVCFFNFATYCILLVIELLLYGLLHLKSTSTPAVMLNKKDAWWIKILNYVQWLLFFLVSSCDSRVFALPKVYLLTPSPLATSLVGENVFPVFWENKSVDPSARMSDINIKDIYVEELDIALGTSLKMPHNR